jgi:hypothetical protein
MANKRNSDGYRKNTSRDGLRSPHISEAVAAKMDVIAQHKGINFTKCVEEACSEYADKYISSLDFIEQQELLALLWGKL